MSEIRIVGKSRSGLVLGALAVSVCLLAGCGAEVEAAGSGDGAKPFVTDRVVEVRITLGEKDWEDLRANAMRKRYYRADFLFDGELIPDVAVRAKGNSSLMSTFRSRTPRVSLKVDFNFFNAARTFRGLKKLSFNNGFSDPTLMRERIALDVFAEMGVPTPRAAHVDLWVNDMHLGLYSQVEQVDRQFLALHFGDDRGDLYKPEMPAAFLTWTPEDLEAQLAEQPAEEADTRRQAQGINVGGGKWRELLRAVGEEPPESDGDDARGMLPPMFPPPGQEGEGSPPGMWPRMFPPPGQEGDEPPLGMWPPMLPPLGQEGGESPPGMWPPTFLPPGQEGDEPPQGMWPPMLPPQGEESAEAPQGMWPPPFPPFGQEGGESPEGMRPPMFPPWGSREGGPAGMGFPGMRGDHLEQMGLKTNENVTDHRALLRLMEVLHETPDEAFPTEIQKVLDVDETLRFLAVSVALVHLDNYIGMGHNYYLYEVDGRFTVIPWDLNMAFGTFSPGFDRDTIIDFYIDEPTSGPVGERPLVARLLAHEPYRAAYHDHLERLLSGPFSTRAMEARIDEAAWLVRKYVAADELKFFSTEDFEAAVAEDIRGAIGLKAFVRDRTTSIREQLDGARVSSADGKGHPMRGGMFDGFGGGRGRGRFDGRGAGDGGG